MLKRTTLLLMSLAALSPGAQSTFDPELHTWTIGNESIQATFELSAAGSFTSKSIRDLRTGDVWDTPSGTSSPVIQLQLGNEVYDSQRMYTLVDQYTHPTRTPGVRQFIVLEDFQKTARLTIAFDVYDDQPVIRYVVRVRNLTGSTVFVDSVNMLPWSFADLGRRYTAFRVNQWMVDATPEDFEPLRTPLDPDGSPVELTSGAHGEQCGWLAVRDRDMRGLFAGWEFDGRAKTSVRHIGSDASLDFSASILDLHHPLAPQEDFDVPAAFIGLFKGDFDEAGYRTQRFVEAVLAKPAPEQGFPYVSWDSWGYEENVDEDTLRRNADLAAAAGVELFVVDLGWARGIGDWHADPRKFPGGLGALADYVHRLGMKFGVHFALAEAAPDSPVLQAHPDWSATGEDSFHGAASLCLSNQPARDWIVEQAIRMIDDYHLDWILQDGENMVKECARTTHTHDPADSNYSNAVNGLNAVVKAVQRARPNVYWENCENGGNMMTFKMVKNYVTSITNDASGSLSARRAVYGATYPFPPRYAERYMPGDEGLSPYVVNSYRFGGNWALMNRLPELTPGEMDFLRQEIEQYKSQRAGISRGKVYHIAPPADDRTDAIESYTAETDSAIAIVTRAASAGPQYIFRPKGLDPNQRYSVFFDIDPSVYSLPGAQLMTDGVRVQLPAEYSSEVVHIQRQ
jgi:alpha-galactosidase